MVPGDSTPRFLMPSNHGASFVEVMLARLPEERYPKLTYGVVVVGRVVVRCHLALSKSIAWCYYKARCWFMWITGGYDMRYVSRLAEDNLVRSCDYRRVFEHPLKSIAMIPMAKNHTHPASATLRSSVNEAFKRLALNAGFIPYSVSAANSDCNEGSRYFYDVKSFGIPYRSDVITDKHCLIFTDVDYYPEMDKYLQLGVPMLIYTFCPLKVAQTIGVDPEHNEQSWCIKDDVVTYHVAGGASYSHEVWDYSGDTISTVTKEGNLINYHVVMHDLIDDPHRRIVMLLPSTVVLWPYWTYLDNNLIPRLQRKKFTHQDFNILFDPVKDTISASANGSYHSVELSSRLYTAIQQRLTNKSSPPVVADIERMLAAAKFEDPATGAALLFEAVKSVKEFRPYITATHGLATTYHPVAPIVTEDVVCPGQPICSPLTSSPALFAAKGVNSDTACIEGRVNAPRNLVTPVKEFKRFQNEFISFMVPTNRCATIVPWTISEVLEKQNRPTQKARYEQEAVTMGVNSANHLRAFIKTETYAGAKAPRNITTCSASLTTMFSCYTYAFKDAFLKSTPWYAPCKTPIEIAERISKIVGHKGAVMADFENMDGSVSQFLQDTVLAIYCRAFIPMHRGELNNWYRKMLMTRATTSTGMKYDAGVGTRSGSPPTTDGNTMIDAFVCYCALRQMMMTPKDAWAVLNDQTIFAGDDSVLPAIPGLDVAFAAATEALGMKAKMSTSLPGQAVGFCGRIFVNPGVTLDSFQDPERTLIKIHLSGNKQVSPVQAAYNKARGYLATDSKTPLIGNWARKILDLCAGTELKDALGEELYKMDHPWPQENAEMIRETFCSFFDWTEAELILKEALIDSVTALDKFPVILENTLTHKIEAVVGDSVVGPGQSSTVIINQDNGGRATQDRRIPKGERPGRVLHRMDEYGRTHHPKNRGGFNNQSGRFQGQRHRDEPTTSAGNRGFGNRNFRANNSARSFFHEHDAMPATASDGSTRSSVSNHTRENK